MFEFLKNKIDGFKNVLANTTQNLVSNTLSNVSDTDRYSDFTLEEIEDTLICADLGVDYSAELIEDLRKKKDAKPSELKTYLKENFKNTLLEAGTTEIDYEENELNIYLITGVNGAGKTTLIAKLAYQFKQEGKKVLIAAGDTFRAAAEEQLNIWSNRAGADIVRRDKADPASVVYEAIKKAKNESYDIILIDTAGRLQNKFNLMEELKKIKTVIDKQAPQNFRESILVIDANTGQNGLQQAKIFSQAVDLTSVALTKLDGSAKGAIIIAIAKEMKLPVKLIGVGEKMTDLKGFNPDDFIDAIFEN